MSERGVGNVYPGTQRKLTSEPVPAVQPRSETCPHARRAVKFYAAKIREHAARIGADVTLSLTKRHGCPRYLAGVLRAKAAAWRVRYEAWQRTIGQTVARLDRGLANAGGFVWLQRNPMRGLGVILERHARRYGISPYFIAAVAATESSLGIEACSSNRFNAWGLSSCGSGWYVPAFRSWDEAIAFFARWAAGRFSGHSTPYSFRGYAACSDCWARKVSYWMAALFNVEPRTRYP